MKNEPIAGNQRLQRKSYHAIRNTQHVSRFMLLLALLAALFLRVYRLADIPAGVDYDEAGNLILAGEIAAGQSRPIFIRAYAGREAIFFWLAAASMRLLGRTLFAFRLAAALCGVGTVLLAYLLAGEMFRDAPDLERRWVPPLSAAMLAVSYWPVHVSRYGFRVNTMPLLMAATMTFLWRGLRRDRWLDLALAGVLCGLSANTYLAVRAFPLVLVPFALWVILTWETGHRYWRWLRLRQIALFALAALAAFAPLGVFFLKNPEFFGIRMGQASILDPEIHGGDLWGTFGRVTVDALGIFTVRGDSNPVYNFDQRPIFGPLLGFCFYLGLLACLWRAGRPRTRTTNNTNNTNNAQHAPRTTSHVSRRRVAPTGCCSLRARTPYLLILIWLPAMLLPNVLGARGVPHSLRSMGLIPAVYYVPALGLLAAFRTAQRVLAGATTEARATAKQVSLEGRPDRQGRNWIGHVPTIALSLSTLVAGGAQTYHWYFDLWTQDAGAYYRSAADVRLAAEYMGQWDADQVTLFVSNDTYRHTTIAAFCPNYSQLKWINGPTLVLPVESARPALYTFDHTNPLDPLLARYIPPGTLQHRERGPDGKVGFEAYLLPPEQMPRPIPQVPVQANLGGVLAFAGYDLNQPAISGDVLDVTLYWRILRDSDPVSDRDDWTFFVHLVDDLGFRWGGETFFHYPSLQWRAGEVVLFHKRIAIAPGAPPGQYTLTLGVFSPSLDARLPVLNQAGQMAGTTVPTGPFDVGRAPAPPATLPPIQQPLDAAFGGALALLGFDRDRGDLRPGETLALSLYWQTTAEIETDLVVSLWLEGDAGHMPLWKGDPVHGRYPFRQWQAGEFIRDRYALRIPVDAPAGDYDLRLALLKFVVPDGTPLSIFSSSSSGRDSVPARSVPAHSGAWISLGTIHVHASDRLWEPPAFAHSVEARLGDVAAPQVELLGYDLDRQQASPGETIRLTLVWRCLGEMGTSYTVFTHLLDESGQIRGQQDNPPVRGSYATTLWVPGEVVVDEYDMTIHLDAPPGTYVLEVGMYDPANLQRLSVLDLTGRDHILLGKIRVGE